MAFGTLVLLFGFYKWEKELQPLLDRTTKAHADIEELQLLKLKRELGLIESAMTKSAKPIANQTSPEITVAATSTEREPK